MSGKRRALITGVTGQDGNYLAKLLFQKDYEVHGVIRRGQDARAVAGVICHFADLSDPAALRQAIVDGKPDEIYNLGAQSHVNASFYEPDYTFRVTAVPILTILEHVRQHAPETRVYQASSSEMFGDSPPPQNERSLFRPRSPYAIAKVAAHHTVSHYRDRGVFTVGGILFNHESPIRPASFVTRKITQGVARIFAGKSDELVLGNLDAKRDWGFAGDYVEAMFLMLQQQEPRDFVIASGNAHSVRDFVITAFSLANHFTGKNLQWEQFVKTDAAFTRPSDVPYLLGNATRACEELGWQPKTSFNMLVRDMVLSDLEDQEAEILRAAV